MTPDIFCIGGASIDHKLKAFDAIESSTSNPVASHITFGGVARNVAENLSNWTNQVYLQCVTGDDLDGQKLLAHAQQSGIHIHDCMVLKQQATASYFAVLDKDGELYNAFAAMEIYNHIPFAAFTSVWVNWPAHSIVFMDTNLPADIIEYAMRHCRDKHIKLCIDPVSTIKARKLPQNLEDVFLLKPNRDEAAALTGLAVNDANDCIRAGVKLLQRGVRNVIISMGEAGYVIVNDEAQEFVQTRLCSQIVDVSGAGDAFIAGILYGTQQHLSVRQACRWGAAAAHHTIKSTDSVAGDLTADNLLAFTQEEQTNAAIF